VKKSEADLRSVIRSILNDTSDSDLLNEKMRAPSRGTAGGSARTFSQPEKEEEEEVSSAATGAAANAEREFQLWGNKDEKHPSMKDTLTAYWKNAGAPDYGTKQPWSAAFISWVMKDEPGFNKSASHSNYMRDAKKARDSGATSGFVAYQPEELPDKQPEPGDLVCRPRMGSGNAWSKIGSRNHCDVYVGGGQQIGGNLGDTSKKVPYKQNKTKMVIKKLAESELRDIIREILSEKMKSPMRGASSGRRGRFRGSEEIEDVEDVTCDPENIRDIPGVVVNPGKNAYIGIGGVKGFAVQEMHGMMRRLQSHLDSNLGPGYTVSSNGVMRTIRKIFSKASKSKLASWNTKHGVGTAIDLKITSPAISNYAGPSITNPKLVNDTKLMKAFKSFENANPKFRWGGTFTSKSHPHQDVPGVGSVDVGELHHWEIRDISPYIGQLKPALVKNNLPVPTPSGDQYKLEPLYRAIAGCDGGRPKVAEVIVRRKKRNKNTKK